MFKFLPGKRYLLRELLPRAVLLTAVFGYIMPMLPFEMFRFDGGVIAAAAFGLAFTAMFSLFGAYIMGGSRVQQFMEEHKRAFWFIPANILLVLGLPFGALVIAQWIAPDTFHMCASWAALVGSVILNLACVITHDYGSESSDRT